MRHGPWWPHITYSLLKQEWGKWYLIITTKVVGLLGHTVLCVQIIYTSYKYNSPLVWYLWILSNKNNLSIKNKSILFKKNCYYLPKKNTYTVCPKSPAPFVVMIKYHLPHSCFRLQLILDQRPSLYTLISNTYTIHWVVPPNLT